MQVVSMKRSAEWYGMLRDFLKEHVADIEPIVRQGGIAMVFWDPWPCWTEGLDRLGWKGETVWRMPARLCRAMQTTDSVTKRWIRRKKGPHRVFVVNGPGSVLINISREKGLYIEPGSLDHDLADELGVEKEPMLVLEDRKMWGFDA